MATKRKRAGIWLGTLAAVVSIATGMFTLRDQVFPSESGSAGAVQLPVYRQQVGGICDRVNDDDRYRAQQDVKVRRGLERARTTTAQRNALLDAVRRTSARSGQTLAAFNGFDPPRALVAVRRDTQAAWNRNLARLRTYAQRLDAVTKRAQLLAAIEYLSHVRPVLAKDGIALRSGLERLGEAQCDLQVSRVTPAFTLPSLPHGPVRAGPAVDTPEVHPSTAKRPASGQRPSLNEPDAGGTPPKSSVDSPSESANTPGESANTPGPSVASPSPGRGSPNGESTGQDSEGGSEPSGSATGSRSEPSGSAAGSGSDGSGASGDGTTHNGASGGGG
jgi:hypothetical protein